MSNGVEAVHDWMYIADLAPVEGAEQANTGLDETAIWIDGQQYWLYAAADSVPNRFLHVQLYSTRTTALTEMFLVELIEKHAVEGAVFLIDSAAWLKAVLHRRSLEFRYERDGDRTAVERVY